MNVDIDMTAEKAFASLHGLDTAESGDSVGEGRDKLADLGLGLGAHLITGWRGQFERMERFYGRFIEAERRQEAQDALDYALAFFIFAHSLREWITKWEQIDKHKVDAEWSQITMKYPEMKVTRDICNVTKHLKMSQSPSVDEHFATFWSYDLFARKNHWIIYFGDSQTPLANLMHQVLCGWQQLIQQLDLR